jgi:peroxiredoxin
MKLKIFFSLIFILTISIMPTLAQKTTISGKIENRCCPEVDLKLLYKDNGISFGKTAIHEDGTFTLIVNLPQTDLYKLVFEEGKYTPLCLSKNQNIELTLDANNFSVIQSVKGSPSIEFFKKASELIASSQMLFDSINQELLTDKDVQFYNGFQSQFQPYFDTNVETDAFCLQVVRSADSLQQFVNSKVVKGKVDSKEIDVFIYTGSKLLKTIDTYYTKYANYVHSMGLFYDFKNNRNTKFEGFYSSSVDKYLDFLNKRDSLMETNFANFAFHIKDFLLFQDSLQIHNLTSKKKEKELLAAKIIELSKKCSKTKETEKNLLVYAKAADGFAKYTLQEAQRNVASYVQNYRTFFTAEEKKRKETMLNYLLANKDDLSILLLLEHFPKNKNAAFYNEVIKALYEKYPAHPVVAELYKAETSSANSTAIGSLAPDLAFENPDGKIMKLSDLKGKVVLLDFWASWCRPCRQENPNVVKTYQKYHEKGFEVYSVSLDKDKANWVKAIQADGLIWSNHVSDLGYWQSEAAKIYNVRSIPATFLIGKDGAIIAKNLRGNALENALKELFE